MALDSDPQKLVTAHSDLQRPKVVRKPVSARDADGTPAPSAEVRQLDPARRRSPRRPGPKTPAGRARVALNPITHGISSTRPVVPGERSDEWETHRRAIVEALAPVGPLEIALAERAASIVWRLRRVTAYEEAAIAERQHLPAASARLLPHPLEIDKIIRYEAHLSRQLLHVLHELEAMRAERRGRPIPLVRMDGQSSTETLVPIAAATTAAHVTASDGALERHPSSPPSHLPGI